MAPLPPRRPDLTATERVRADAYRALRDERDGLAARVGELTGALNASVRENQRLLRELRRVAAENHDLRRASLHHAVAERLAPTERHSHIHRMLSERGSRNP